MIYENYNYNKGEDLNHCPICKKVFKEGEHVSVINPAKGPFMIIPESVSLALNYFHNAA